MISNHNIKYINLKYIDQEIFEESYTHSKLILDGIHVISQFDNVYRVDEYIEKWIVTEGSFNVRSGTGQFVDNIKSFVESFKWKLILGVSCFILLYLIITSIIFSCKNVNSGISEICKIQNLTSCRKAKKNDTHNNEIEQQTDEKLNLINDQTTGKFLAVEYANNDLVIKSIVLNDGIGSSSVGMVKSRSASIEKNLQKSTTNDGFASGINYNNPF